MNNDLMFSSKSNEWTTPQDFFDKVNEEFDFDTDTACTEENAKCPSFITEEKDGLKMKWHGRCWCNPPYGRGLKNWVEKASNEIRERHCELIVMLIPARTDTRYFHEFIYNKHEIRFIKGRLKFSDAKSPAPFPSMLIIFKK